MAQGAERTRGTYQASISSRCWWCTTHDDGWEKCPSLRGQAAPVGRWLVRLPARKLEPPEGRAAAPRGAKKT